MATSEKVTVDRADFYALLRRANFYASSASHVRPTPADVVVAKVEYDSLLRTSREYELLRNALFQGGVTSETLDILITGSDNAGMRKDSGIFVGGLADDTKAQTPSDGTQPIQDGLKVTSRRESGTAPRFIVAPGNGLYRADRSIRHIAVQASSTQRHSGIAIDLAPARDLDGFDEPDEYLVDVDPYETVGKRSISRDGHNTRTLYFAGLGKETTHKDLLSVIKGGKVMSMALRPERSAVVTLLDGAAEFLAWAKREDLYINSKRVDVRWADREFKMNDHIRNKIMNGATRNLVVRNASRNGLTESQIREDMDHIHSLVIVDIVFRNGDALVSTNAVHNALFARTCMMSRTSYKGCKVDFHPDECDVTLPARTYPQKVVRVEPPKQKASISNRFGCLDIDDGVNSSDEENRSPLDFNSDNDETLEVTSHPGVSLNFLDTDSF